MFVGYVATVLVIVQLSSVTPFDTDPDADPVPNSDTCHFFYTPYMFIVFRLQALTKPPFNKMCKVR